MAINDVLSLKAARRGAITDLKSFLRVPGHQRLNVDDLVYIHYAVPLYSAGIAIMPTRLRRVGHSFVELKTVQ